MTGDPLSCPVDACTVDDILDAEELGDHLFCIHETEELTDTIVRLDAAVRSARAHTQCQRCGNFGAEPGDHPLCESCEKEIRG